MEEVLHPKITQTTQPKQRKQRKQRLSNSFYLSGPWDVMKILFPLLNDSFECLTKIYFFKISKLIKFFWFSFRIAPLRKVSMNEKILFILRYQGRISI